MSTQLTRSADDRMLGGVCGGLARYFGVDSSLVRLVFVLAVLSGLSPLIYVVLWVVMPQEGAQQPNATPRLPDPTGEWQYDPYTGEKIAK